MLKNEKILKNNDKLIKGIHLESYITINPGLTNNYIYYGTDGVSSDSPLNILLYDSEGYTFKEETVSVPSTQITYSNTNTSLTKFFLTYGNTDALIKFQSNSNGVIDGDLKGFINHHTNLKDIDVSSTSISVNFDNFVWPKGLDEITFSLCPNVTGDWDSMSNLDELTYLNISRTPFSGDLIEMTNLTELRYDGWQAYDYLVGDITTWSFIPNLTYFYIRYQDNVTGNISGLTFNDGLTYFRWDSMSGMEGDISNWDFSNCTSLGNFQLSFDSGTQNNVTGDLSNWSFGQCTNFQLRYAAYTNLDIDLSNTNCASVNLSSLTSVSSNMSGFTMSDSCTYIYVYDLRSWTGDINDFYIPPNMTTFQIQRTSAYGDLVEFFNNNTGMTNIYFTSSDCTGDLSGLTLWDGITYFVVSDNQLSGTLSATNTTIPTSMYNFSIDRNYNAILDLTTTFDFHDTQNLTLYDISGVTGDFSNLIIDNCNTFSLQQIGFLPDLGNLSFDWDTIVTINLTNIDDASGSDITNWFPSGGTSNINTFQCYGSDELTGDITNWDMGTYRNYNSYTYFTVYNSSLYGDLSNWDSPMPRSIQIDNTWITGDIGALDFTTNGTEYAYVGDAAMYGDLSGVTIDYRCRYFEANNQSGVTGTDEFVDYIWAARKSWINTFRINISNIGDTITGTYQLGDLGTYTGHEWDLTEAEINNLVAGNDYDGGGTNTPWTQNEKRYYMLNAKQSSGSTTDKYKVYDFLVS